MKGFRHILFPLGLLFGFVGMLRRALYDSGLLKRKRGAIKSIVIGNITVGGTGKTPFVIWIAKQLAMKKVAILSRGYGRNSKGFGVLKPGISAELSGDEPLEIFEALEEKIPVFVCENRIDGLERIRTENSALEIALLDDGFQHLRLRPEFSILLCDYNRPFFSDWPMPWGNLREFAHNARFSDAIVVTKCPQGLGMEEAMQLYGKLAKYGKPVFFATYRNSEVQSKNGESLQKGSEAILISGLASNTALDNWVTERFVLKSKFQYGDHYAYTEREVQEWRRAMSETGVSNVITSRKDRNKIMELAPDIRVFETHSEVELLFNGGEALIALILTKIEK